MYCCGMRHQVKFLFTFGPLKHTKPNPIWTQLIHLKSNKKEKTIKQNTPDLQNSVADINHKQKTKKQLIGLLLFLI